VGGVAQSNECGQVNATVGLGAARVAGAFGGSGRFPSVAECVRRPACWLAHAGLRQPYNRRHEQQPVVCAATFRALSAARINHGDLRVCEAAILALDDSQPRS
jgi:hypothetical protein